MAAQLNGQRLVGSLIIAAMTLATPLAGALESLGKSRLEAVEAGGGSVDEQFRYVAMCLESAPCSLALMQVWQANGKEVPLARYLPPEDKIPALFRGTDIGNKLRNTGAVNSCMGEEPCRRFLVDATKAVRTLPPDQLKQLYASKVELEKDAMQRDGLQIQANLQQSVAQASVRSPEPASAPAAAPGGVIDFARDPYTNSTVQLLNGPSGNREIQVRRAGQARRIATVLGREGKWLIELNDGKQVEASDIQLTSRGFVAGTSAQPMSYSDAGGLVKLNWPQGYRTAATQRGNTAQTGYLLLERDAAQLGAAANLLNSFKSLGAALGSGRTDDYLLLDLHSARTFPVNVSSSGKTIATSMSGCRAKNSVLNVCRDATYQEAAFDRLGKNMGHYGWLIYWMRAPGGTYLIALEDTMRNLTVTKLETGEKRVAFTRTLGIRDFSVKQDDAGKIALSAQLAFDLKQIDDLEAAFAALPPAAPVPVR